MRKLRSRPGFSPSYVDSWSKANHCFHHQQENSKTGMLLFWNDSILKGRT